MGIQDKLFDLRADLEEKVGTSATVQFDEVVEYIGRLEDALEEKTRIVENIRGGVSALLSLAE